MNAANQIMYFVLLTEATRQANESNMTHKEASKQVNESNKTYKASEAVASSVSTTQPANAQNTSNGEHIDINMGAAAVAIVFMVIIALLLFRITHN